MKYHLTSRFAFVSVVILLLSACTPLAPIPTLPSNTYLLTDPISSQDQNTRTNQTKKTLLVSVPSAPRWLNSSDMVYQTSPSKMSSFVENEWVAPPALMLEPIIAHALQKSGLYRAVVQAPFGGNPDQRLDVQIIKMQQDFTENPSLYRMVVQVALIDMITGNIIRSQRFSYAVPTASNDPQGGVQAANKAIEEWIPQLIAFCRKSPANT